MNFQEEFNARFGDKYQNLQLKNVVVKKDSNELVVTFLYPSTVPELTAEEKHEIIAFIKENVNLEKLELKVKFMRVFLEEKLVLKAISAFFEQKYKLVTTYLNENNFKVSITPIDVQVDVELSTRMHDFFIEHKVVAELTKYLKDNFLVDFIFTLIENKDFVDEVDIQNVQMKTVAKPISRYNVEIVKEVVGKGIITKPEYLSYITAPKNSVVVAGFIRRIERRDFVIKKGKRAGQSKAYFSFTIQDDKGKIDCIYFCAKCYEKVMESLEEFMFVLVHGDVRLNQQNKLCLYADKIALANKLEKQPEEIQEKEHNGHVVNIEKFEALEQDTMFGEKNRYNKKILGKKIVVFDIETTGLDPEQDQIIEIGAVKIDNGNIIEKFASFVRPTVEISRDITNLTGISQDMVENAPDVQDVIKDFYDFTHDCIISGHNIINFDIKFIRREGEIMGLDFDNELIDTLSEARTARLKLTKFNLSALTNYLGIKLEGAHRAWNDAYATAQVLLRLNEIK